MDRAPDPRLDQPMISRCIRLAALTLALTLSSCAGLGPGDRPPIPLARVDVSRMYGGWYLIATMRNGFEKGMVGPYDVYSKRPDGDIREDFYVRRASFQAPQKHFTLHDWVRPGTGGGHWRVQLFWPINLPFLVFYVDPDYRYTLFGEQNRKLGWIYARTPVIPDADYEALKLRFQAMGYNSQKFVKFVQTPAEIGRPGFWSDGIH
jgi:apolipoprotein D and lipocalin family protein